MTFKLFGTRIRISFLFTAVLALMTATDQTGDLFLFDLAALIHEAFHLIFMLLFGVKPKEILLIPGGINIVQKGYVSKMGNIGILIAGPISNLVCFLCFKGTFAAVNLLLFLYNIMPLQGLDGGKLLRMFLEQFFKPEKVNIVLKCVSIVFLIFFILLFFIGLRVNTVNISILIFSLYIISSIFLKKRLKETDN